MNYYYLIDKGGKIFKKFLKGGVKTKSSQKSIIKDMDKHGGVIVFDATVGKFVFMPDKSNNNSDFADNLSRLPIKNISRPVIRINAGDLYQMNDLNRILMKIIIQQKQLLLSNVGAMDSSFGPFGPYGPYGDPYRINTNPYSSFSYGRANPIINRIPLTGTAAGPAVGTSGASPAGASPAGASPATRQQQSAIAGAGVSPNIVGATGSSSTGQQHQAAITGTGLNPAITGLNPDGSDPAATTIISQASHHTRQNIPVPLGAPSSISQSISSGVPPPPPRPWIRLPNPSLPQTDKRQAFLDEIQQGKQLKKVVPQPKPASTSSGSLISGITGNPLFKKAEAKAEAEAIKKRRTAIEGTPSPEGSPERQPPLVPAKRESIDILQELITKLYDGPLKASAVEKFNEATTTNNKVGLSRLVSELTEVLNLCNGITQDFDNDLYVACQTTDINDIKTKIKAKRNKMNIEMKDIDDTCMDQDDKIKLLEENDNTVKKLKENFDLNYDKAKTHTTFKNELIAFILTNVLNCYTDVEDKEDVKTFYDTVLKKSNCDTLFKLVLFAFLKIINKRLKIIKSKFKIDTDEQFKKLHTTSILELWKILNDLVYKLSRHYGFAIKNDYSEIFVKYIFNIEYINKYSEMIQHIRSQIGVAIIKNVQKIHDILFNQIYTLEFIKNSIRLLNFEQSQYNNFSSLYLKLLTDFNIIRAYKTMSIIPHGSQTISITPQISKYKSTNSKYNNILLKLRESLINIKDPFLLIQYNLNTLFIETMQKIDSFDNKDTTFNDIFKNTQLIIKKINFIISLNNTKSIAIRSSLTKSQNDDDLITKVNNQIELLTQYEKELNENFAKLNTQDFIPIIDKELTNVLTGLNKPA